MLNHNGYAAYANSKIMTASPAELTLMLYDGALQRMNSMHTISMGMRMTAQLPERKTNCWQRSKKIRILWRDSCSSLQQDYMILLIRK